MLGRKVFPRLTDPDRCKPAHSGTSSTMGRLPLRTDRLACSSFAQIGNSVLGVKRSHSVILVISLESNFAAFLL